ncbi:MAG: hypothetical protein WKF47_12675 [Geodermatophilaceae bacterium]
MTDGDAQARLAADRVMGADRGIRDFRKHVGWYLKGFGVGGPVRAELSTVDSLSELEWAVGDTDGPVVPDRDPAPRRAPATPLHPPRHPSWLLDLTSRAVPFGAERDHSGG